MLKKLITCAFAVVMVMSTAPAFAKSYGAIAAGWGGSVYVYGYSSMERARNAAIQQCRAYGYGSCTSSVAEDENWYYAAGVCDGQPYTGASPQGWWRAAEIVWAKAAADGRGNCDIFAEH